MRHWVGGWRRHILVKILEGRLSATPKIKQQALNSGILDEIPDFWIKQIWILSIARPRDKAGSLCLYLYSRPLVSSL